MGARTVAGAGLDRALPSPPWPILACLPLEQLPAAEHPNPDASKAHLPAPSPPHQHTAEHPDPNASEAHPSNPSSPAHPPTHPPPARPTPAEHPDPNTSEAHLEVWLQQVSKRWSEVPHMAEAIKKARDQGVDGVAYGGWVVWWLGGWESAGFVGALLAEAIKEGGGAFGGAMVEMIARAC